MIAVAVALVVVVNIIMGEMPSSWTAIDISLFYCYYAFNEQN